MNAISLHQPYASAMALGLKSIETRSWKPPEKCVGERFAIASTKAVPFEQYVGGPFSDGEDVGGRYHVQPDVGVLYDCEDGRSYPLPLGCVVASGVLVDGQPIGHLVDCSWITTDTRLPIPGFPGYAITITGEVWTADAHRSPGTRISTQPGRQGYPSVSLRVLGVRSAIPVHRLVGGTWLLPVPGATEVRHFDGNRENNAAWNLRWGTRSENVKDTRRLGERAWGTDRTGARFSAEQVDEIRRRGAEGEPILRLAKEFDANRMTIRRVLADVTYRDAPDEPDDSVARSLWAWRFDEVASVETRCPWCWGARSFVREGWRCGCGRGARPVDLCCPWDLNAWDRKYDCLVCAGAGSCAPIPVTGKQRVWDWEPS